MSDFRTEQVIFHSKDNSKVADEAHKLLNRQTGVVHVDCGETHRQMYLMPDNSIKSYYTVQCRVFPPASPTSLQRSLKLGYPTWKTESRTLDLKDIYPQNFRSVRSYLDNDDEFVCFLGHAGTVNNPMTFMQCYPQE